MLDVSGSVEERIDFIRKAARDFLRTASPQDRISIISFHDDIKVISNFTTDRSLLSRRLDELDAGGATALYDALGYTLVDALKPLRGERTAVVIMSDGDDNKSFVPFPAILEAVVESGALVYPLYVPSGLIPESSVPKPSLTVDPYADKVFDDYDRARRKKAKSWPAFQEACFIRSSGSRTCRKHTMTSWPRCARRTQLPILRRPTVPAIAEFGCGLTATELRCA